MHASITSLLMVGPLVGSLVGLLGHCSILLSVLRLPLLVCAASHSVAEDEQVGVVDPHSCRNHSPGFLQSFYLHGYGLGSVWEMNLLL